jgi:hypothetical protein
MKKRVIAEALIEYRLLLESHCVYICTPVHLAENRLLGKLPSSIAVFGRRCAQPIKTPAVKTKAAIARGLCGLTTYGQSQFERHVESRRCRRISVQLHPRQIVHRIRARLDEIDDPVQARLAPRNSECCPRLEAKLDDADYVSQVETLKLRVVGNVQENSFGLSVLSGHVCQPSAWRTLSLPLFSPGGHAEVQNHYGRHFFSFRRPVEAGHRDGFR